ncbi:MAG: hypothetical protein QOJ03_467 [Frankiaceae bacterium]|jgi:hypothetical protein|nr:hypothetical protein [Frankiaceae bacterium]
MNRVRRLAVAAALALAGSGAVLLAVVTPAAAQAPAVTAWWSALNAGDPAPAPPAPPDVPAGDLLVQGSNAVPVALPLGSAPAGTQAIAGLSFDVAPTDVVGALTLKLDGSPPPTVSVVACRALSAFTEGGNQPWSGVPGFDDAACVPGVLKEDSVVFASVSKLVTTGALRILLVPGPVDRIVVKKPGDASLEVRSSRGFGAGAPPLGSGTSVGRNPSSGSSGGGPVAPAGDAGVVGPSSGGTLPPSSTTSGTTDTPPVVATPPATGSGAAAALARTSDSGMSVGTRRLIAGIVIALEVLGFMALAGSPAPVGPAVAGAGALVAGGRLRPPDRLVGGPRGTQSGGVGRFRRERQGAAPRL